MKKRIIIDLDEEGNIILDLDKNYTMTELEDIATQIIKSSEKKNLNLDNGEF